MGEGSHFYKIKGTYYIVSAIPGAHVPMKCARAGKLTGPWEADLVTMKLTRSRIEDGMCLHDIDEQGLIPAEMEAGLPRCYRQD